MTDQPTAEAYAAAANWFRRWLGSSHVRKSDLKYGQEVVDAVWPIAVAAVRAQVAAEIRAWATKVQDRAEAEAGVPTGAGDDHPLPIGMEFAARIAEGDTET